MCFLLVNVQVGSVIRGIDFDLGTITFSKGNEADGYSV